ncbi:unnamed protein product, partial [Ectocarpus sp. 8 AP-2014]
MSNVGGTCRARWVLGRRREVPPSIRAPPAVFRNSQGGIKYAMFNDSQLLHKVVNGDLLGVQELVNAGVSVNGSPRLLRDIPLILASVKGHTRVAKFLIARGANLESACLEDVVNENGEMSARKGTRALHLSSSPEMTSVLLKAGFCPNATDADGCTPLMR